MKFKQKFAFGEGNIKTFILSQLLIVVFIVASTTFSFSIFYRYAKENLVTVSQKTITNASEKLNNFFTKGSDVLVNTSENVTYMMRKNSSDMEIAEYLGYVSKSKQTSIIGNYTGFYGVINGKYVDGTGWIPGPDYIPEQRDWYIDAKKAGGEVVIVPPYIDAETKNIVVSIAKLLPDNKSVLSLDLRFDEVHLFAEDVVLGSSDEFFIMDRTGTIIAHTLPEKPGKHYFDVDGMTEETRLIKQIMLQGHDVTFETKYKNQKELVFVKPVIDDWFVVMLTDKVALVKNVLGRLLFIFIGHLLVLILVIAQCSINFQARLHVSKYAKILSRNKSELEHQVIDQWNQLDKKNHDLVQMQATVIEGMATIIEYRDVNTGMHVQNTKHYAVMIARYLLEHGLHTDEVNEKYLSMLSNAAAMHDIGKVAINDRILNKPDKLTDDEYETMKMHTIIGAGLVRQVFGKTIDEDMLRMCVDVVQYHHEKWNGKGYPIGLIGEDIPLSARIMAIADVFDAIVSKRVYKEAVPFEQVFEIIRKDAGSHFDPELAEIFLSMKDEVVAYLNKSISEAELKIPTLY